MLNPIMIGILFILNNLRQAYLTVYFDLEFLQILEYSSDSKMPTEMSSWADEIDETDTSLILPPPSEKVIGNQKIMTEYSHNEDGKKVITTLNIMSSSYKQIPWNLY